MYRFLHEYAQWTAFLSVLAPNPLQADYGLTQTLPPSSAAGPPPIACLIHPVAPIQTDQLVTFDVDAQADPPLFYSWLFGDNSPATRFETDSGASHIYTSPGHYTVSVTLSNANHTQVCSTLQIVHRPLTAGRPTTSSTILFDSTRNQVWTVNPDADTVTALDALALNQLFETEVGQHPRTLAQGPSGEIWVVNQGSASISRVHPDTGQLVYPDIALPRASRPYGIVISPDQRWAYVTLQGTGHLLRLDTDTGRIDDTLPVCPTPRGLAISADSRRILLSRFISPDTEGRLVEIDADSFEVTRTLTLGLDPGPDAEDAGRGLPNYLSALTISPDGQQVWVPSKKDNIQRGLNRDGEPLTFENSVRTIISQVDLYSNQENLTARIDLNDRDMAAALQFSPLGNMVFCAVQGANVVDVFDAYSGFPVTSLDEVGRAPQGLVLSPDGRRLFVQNFMSRSVSVFNTSTLITGQNKLAPKLAEISTVRIEKLPAAVLRGKQIFYDASDERINLDGYISCASCHLDGEQDGRTWDFTDRGEGFRNTISLIGRAGTDHGRVHWSANFDEIQDFEHDIRGPFGGLGLMSDAEFNTGTRNQPLGDPKAGVSSDLDALAAYVRSLDHVNPSPYRAPDGSLTIEAVAGKTLFAQLNCATCHVGNRFTDSPSGLLHDVGTLKPSSGNRLGEPLTGLDTPTLKGLWETAPYLHDGSAATLMEILTTANPAGLHGDTAPLAPSQLNQLVAYLLQIDESEIVELTLGDVGLADDQVHFTLPTLDGHTYTVEYTDSLSPAQWQVLQLRTGDGTVQTILDAPPEAQRFYRIIAHE